MNYNISDDIIVKGIREGNEVVFKFLYENYHTPLLILARRYLINTTDCKDCIQTVFMRIWINRLDFTITESLNSYLYTAVKNECLNQISKNKNLINTDFNTYISNQYDPLNPESILELQQLQEKIKYAISELPERAQIAFKLNRFNNKTYKEIAFQLGVSLKTIESDISKALVYIKSNLFLILTIINLIFVG